LIHIYHHKANFSFPDVNKRKFNNSRSKSKTLKKEDTRSENIQPTKKFSLETEKEKIKKMNEAVRKAKEDRIREAKELKEKNRLIKENITIFKEKLL
jgi:hypothetical protein